MSKNNLNIPIGSIICAVIAIALFIWSFSVVAGVDATAKEVTRDMVVLDELKVMPENEGKPVMISGKISIKKDSLSDEEFGVKIKTPRLKRTVFMYQWEEEKVETKNEDDEVIATTYKHNKVWANYVIDADLFKQKFRGALTTEKYKNPTKKPIEDAVFTTPIYLGEFVLTDDQVKNFEVNTIFKDLDEKIGEEHGLTIVEDCYTDVVKKTPDIGDIKIRFEYIDLDVLENITILAMQKGNTLEAYTTEKGKIIDKFWLKSLSEKEVAAELQKDVMYTKVGIGIFIVIFLVIAIVLFINRDKGETKNVKNEVNENED